MNRGDRIIEIFGSDRVFLEISKVTEQQYNDFINMLQDTKYIGKACVSGFFIKDVKYLYFGIDDWYLVRTLFHEVFMLKKEGQTNEELKKKITRTVQNYKFITDLIIKFITDNSIKEKDFYPSMTSEFN